MKRAAAGFVFDVDDLGEPLAAWSALAWFFYDSGADRWAAVDGPAPNRRTWAAWSEVA